MTRWVLRCTSCGGRRSLDLGYNLYEFKRLYVFCETCQRNTFHEILGHEEEEEGDS